MAKQPASIAAEMPQEQRAASFSKRIGSIVYEVDIRFNPDAKETMNDKILRLIKNEANMGPPQNHRFCGERRSDGVNELLPLGRSEGYEVRDDEKAAGG